MLYTLAALLAVAVVGREPAVRMLVAPDTLTLSAMLAELAARSPQLRAARAGARAAAARIGPARRLPDPQLQFATMNRDLPGFELNDPLGMNQVQVMQMLPLGGKLDLAARSARADSAAAVYRIADTWWNQRTSAVALFVEVWRADASIAVMEETITLLNHLASTTEAMYRVGEGRQADVLRAQVELARMQEEILRMSTMRTSWAARLNALLDRPADEPIPPLVLPDLAAELPAPDSLLGRASLERPLLVAGEYDVAAAQAAEKRASKELWPDLQLGAIYGQRSMDDGTERMLSLMVGASVPIWAGSRQKQMKLEAIAMREMAEADLSAMRAETRGMLTETLAEVGRARRLRTLYRSTILPQAEATVVSSLTSYRAGAVDFMTVLDNQMTVNRYRLDALALVADEVKALAQLEALTAHAWVLPDVQPAPSDGDTDR
jgi:cobalt-zinc-cadmium efflux system outer membrane protein